MLFRSAKDDHKEASAFARDMMATYKDSEDLINIGAYVKGSNDKVDLAINYIKSINEYLCQDVNEQTEFDESVSRLKSIFE